MCDFDDDDAGTLLTNEWRKARKAHLCYACHEEIRPSDKYHFTSQVYDGSAETFKHCARCWAMVRAIWDQGEVAQWDLNCGDTWEDVFDGPPPEEVARLAFLTADEGQELVEGPRRGEPGNQG